MGENTEMTAGRQSRTDWLQEEIRHTEGDISHTVQAIEERLSPTNIRRRAITQAKLYFLKSVANVIDLVQRRPLEAALVGTGAVWLLARKKKGRSREKTATGMGLAGMAARAFVSGAAGRQHKEESHSGPSLVWRGLATAVGAALGSSWYKRKPAGLRAEAGIEQHHPGAHRMATPHMEPAAR